MAMGSEPQPLGQILKEIIRRWGLQPRVDAMRIVETWAALAGPQINRVTDSAWVRDRKLYVRLTSAAWRHTLHLQRAQWCARLNEALGASLIDDIVFK
ncbi:Protein of unknown function [Rhodothermus profundi]|uniref:DUF721 domain-containing protein n=2 Tax=Rhodothermus profundi TaxID=633813 RepID=A0A1M6RGK9_9BACT|nr:Protein of unknown function [Rhodothermus profundi]